MGRARSEQARQARRRLRGWDVLVAAQMLWLLAKLAFLQRVLSLPTLIHFFDAAPGRSRPLMGRSRLIWLSRAVLVRTHRADFCMEQSLVLFYFLRKWGEPVHIHFGIRREADALVGHAWLTLDGRPVVEARAPESVYATTFSYPSIP